MIAASGRRSAWGGLLVGVAACGGPTASVPVGVNGYERPPGMPIGTGASGGELPDPPSLDNSDLAIPEHAPKPEAPPPPVPCDGCVELQVYVNDINQRDEFAVELGGVAVTRVVWTVRVNFNSDQLAVQPFVDDVYGKYTNLHVNTFPLGAPVEVEQALERNAQRIGLVIGSSGAWTGDQRISVFVDAVRIEGRGAIGIPESDYIFSIANLRVLPPEVLGRARRCAINFA